MVQIMYPPVQPTNFSVSPFLSGNLSDAEIETPHEMLFSARRQCHYRHQRWPCLGMRNPTIHPVNISSPRSRLSDLFGEVGDFLTTGHWVTGWSVSRGFCSCTNLGSLGQIWNLQLLVGYLRYPDSRISWCSCWRAWPFWAELLSVVYPKKIPGKHDLWKDVNTFCWEWLGYDVALPCFRYYWSWHFPSHPDMGFWPLWIVRKKKKNIPTGYWNLNVKCMLNVHLECIYCI